jgi:hypothetical protein
MRPSPPDDDATIVLRPARRPSSRRRYLLWAVAAAGILVAVRITGLVSFDATQPAVSVVTAPPAFAVQVADEAAILAHVTNDLTVFRLATAPDVVVLDFGSLHEQGLMLNRVAALVEKSGLPRDRVLSDDELLSAIRARGDTMETFYYGHDYAAASLARFFTLADRQRITLDSEEQRLRALLQQLGWFQPGALGALISLPRVGADANMTSSARAAILHHELSHGIYFTTPAYAAYVGRFWDNTLSDTERAGVVRFLAGEGYDVGEGDLMRNEMQAYLMFTADPHFFRPSDIGIDEARRIALQRTFLQGMPMGWLKDVLATDLAAR